MNLCISVALALITWQPIPQSVHHHWCDKPTHKLRWLNHKLKEIAIFPHSNNGWEMHQARYWGQEVFVLHLFRHGGKSRGFLLYNHHGELIVTWERADSVQLADMISDRMLAASPGRLKNR
ncbi:hypothetical protein G8759_14855 [Spirosoma aureum]|uniref:Uncharacterized protein n=1 Tax=Spirosoma aureum TaxID=2692134 RepID=A0A6G9AN77_9BACT|nr:hypothetical protein [Spirosoma aureum]QIP13799.1 hypothetical protein G8759_14855 [Spirosoma aureum]